MIRQPPRSPPLYSSAASDVYKRQFQICVMAGFAKLQLEPSIVSMYSEHLERFADVALTETTQETEKIERYMVNIIGDAQIQDFLRRADEEQSAELPPVLSTELRNRILSYTDYDNIITAIYLCLLYTSPSPRDRQKSRMPSSA